MWRKHLNACAELEADNPNTVQIYKEAEMLHFLEQEGYTLVVPGPGDTQWYQKLMDYGHSMNRPYLEALTEPPPGGWLTGSFIYSHPPDYVGRPTMTWNAAEWRGLFQELKEMGIDTVIYQAAAWVEVRECNYRSKLFSDYRTWNSFDPLVEAVAAEGMTFYMGGLGNLLAFDEKATAETLEADRDLQLACFHELLELYRGGFHGFYMSPETGYPGQRQPQREQLLNTYYREVCQGVKEALPDLPILLSPSTYHQPNHEQDCHDFLYNLFQGCPIDVMCPQDSIGTFGNRLPHLEPSFAVCHQLCREIGCELWVNVESFERTRIGTSQDFVSADFKRLAVQLAHASRVGKKIVSWEVPYFYSPLAGERGIRLRKAYLESLAAGERT
jgi:hypothetical protein